VFDARQYELLDFGNGRKLERFGSVCLDRPCEAARGILPTDPEAWAHAAARYLRCAGASGRWMETRPLPERWIVSHGRVTLELKPTPFGHLGVFAEQAPNWDWIGGRLAERAARVLNLVAYTGGSSLAAAAAGAEVVHVDAANNVVAWARRNAELSGLADAPIRWITEDARRFVEREIRRNARYDAIILDPPSYGRGPRGEPFLFSRHLESLLQNAGRLLSDEPAFLLLTHHSSGPAALRANDWFCESTGGRLARGQVESGELTIRSRCGRLLPSGNMIRWPKS
jgi:23S rRNA (cytosine1962-C5)-methyltransferase